jgi:Protein of unknown function (DUF3224)
MTTASGSFTVASWQEGTKVTRATVSLEFSGGIEGKAAVQCVMPYRPDGTAHFVRLARVKGMLHGRPGSVVLENTGEFDGVVARGEWSLVAGTATGDLEVVAALVDPLQ